METCCQAHTKRECFCFRDGKKQNLETVSFMIHVILILPPLELSILANVCVALDLGIACLFALPFCAFGFLSFSLFGIV